jgi:hypothetical protein
MVQLTSGVSQTGFSASRGQKCGTGPQSKLLKKKSFDSKHYRYYGTRVDKLWSAKQFNHNTRVTVRSHTAIILLPEQFNVQIEVKDSRNRTAVTQRDPGGLGSQISWYSAHEFGEVLSLTHRPPLPPRMFLVLIFTRDWFDPRAMVRLEGICHWNIKWYHWKSIAGQSQ